MVGERAQRAYMYVLLGCTLVQRGDCSRVHCQGIVRQGVVAREERKNVKKKNRYSECMPNDGIPVSPTPAGLLVTYVYVRIYGTRLISSAPLPLDPPPCHHQKVEEH